MIARHIGAFSGKSLVDVGCGDGSWVAQVRQRGASSVRGMEERSGESAPANDAIILGSPAASVPFESHSLDAILFRGTTHFRAAEFSPELMICLANLGSSLKGKGRLLIPLAGTNAQEIEAELMRWKNQLSVFPGAFHSRMLTTGLMGYLTLSFLFGRNQPVSVIEFQIHKNVASRLEWHQLARAAVMSRLNSVAVA